MALRIKLPYVKRFQSMSVGTDDYQGLHHNAVGWYNKITPEQEAWRGDADKALAALKQVKSVYNFMCIKHTLTAARGAGGGRRAGGRITSGARPPPSLLPSASSWTSTSSGGTPSGGNKHGTNETHQERATSSPGSPRQPEDGRALTATETVTIQSGLRKINKQRYGKTKAHGVKKPTSWIFHFVSDRRRHHQLHRPAARPRRDKRCPPA